MSHAEEDAVALRQELASVRARQEVLAEALAAAGEQTEILAASFTEIRSHAEEALRALDLDYEQGSRIDRAVQAIEKIQEIVRVKMLECERLGRAEDGRLSHPGKDPVVTHMTAL